MSVHSDKLHRHQCREQGAHWSSYIHVPGRAERMNGNVPTAALSSCLGMKLVCVRRGEAAGLCVLTSISCSGNPL